MALDFNVDEIFEMAEQIERNGARFYRKIAEGSPKGDVRNLFLQFAEMEEEHEKIFISMRAELSDKDKKSTLFDPEGESAQYLRALADLRVFDGSADEDFAFFENLAEEEKMKRAFRAAIDLEKESIVFYQGMKEFVPESLGKDKIDDIIKEEMQHVRILSNKLLSST
ncbi:MAG: ferritin family protein [Deltaproteobacteria bacterium]|nr:ferritin family protein [Deltaproteobacteria bacterium]